MTARLLIAGSIVLLYLQVSTFDFLNGWDDNIYVTGNLHLSASLENVLHWFKAPALGHYIPVTMLSYMFDYGLWGLKPSGFHAQNIFWHVAASLALFQLMGLLGFRRWTALFAALIFACHPQRIESVAWISERKDAISAALYLIALCVYLGRRDRMKFDPAAFAIFILAMLSKSIAMSFPVVLAAYEVYAGKRFAFKDILRRLWPYFLVSAAWLPLSFMAHAELNLGEGQDYLPGARIFAVVYNYMWYFSKTLLPLDLCPIYPKTALSAVSSAEVAVFYLAVLALSAAIYKRHRAQFLFVFVPLAVCYAAALAPVSGIVPIGAIDKADRYSHLPSVFIIVGMAFLLQRHAMRRINGLRRALVAASVSAYILFLGGYAFLYAPAFKNVESLFVAAAEHEPPNPLALGTLAEIKILKGDYEGAFALAEALGTLEGGSLTERNIRGNRLKADFLKGQIFFAMGEKQGALDIFGRLIFQMRTAPFFTKKDRVSILAQSADCLLSLGRKDEALGNYREIASMLSPDCYDYFFYSGLLEYFSGNREAAAENFEKALKFAPNDTRARRNLEECKGK